MSSPKLKSFAEEIAEYRALFTSKTRMPTLFLGECLVLHISIRTRTKGFPQARPVSKRKPRRDLQVTVQTLMRCVDKKIRVGHLEALETHVQSIPPVPDSFSSLCNRCLSFFLPAHRLHVCNSVQTSIRNRAREALTSPCVSIAVSSSPSTVPSSSQPKRRCRICLNRIRNTRATRR